MPRILHLTPLALALVVTGCALNPAASPDPVKLPSQYLVQVHEAGEASASMANWWSRYQDPELLRLIGLANAHNQDITVSLAQYDKALAVLGATRSIELPSVTVSAGSTRESTNTANERTRSSIHSASGLASFELGMWGRLSNATKADAQTAEAAREYSLHTQNLIRNAVIQQYWSIRQLDALSEVIAKQIEARRQQLTISEQKLAFGVTSELDVQQAKADLASLERSRISTKTSREGYLQSLAILVGTPDLTLSAGTGMAEPLRAPTMGLPSLLLQQRPDIKQAENQLQAAGFDVAVARAALFPSIGLSAQGGGRSASLSSMTGAGSSFWTLGYTLDLPLFDGGLRLSQIDQAKAAQREVAALYQKTILTAFADVNQALIETEGWNKQTPWMQDELSAAQKAMDFAQRKYAVGTVDYSTVLDTQKSLLDAEKSSVEIRYGKLISQANLYYALGY
ncbi:efflux transporter outer membrane subunit [Pseudomonas taiwanensis]|uniref:efflux transporter outer membrane subunit n=1 Tax=Pseudomonas taiwanensis TaxID=470150 RepID=UPI0028DE5CFC|nr:efflux transporter outer membrane subunit [Pseudomonas taiwanensis]MDT8925192.1 efflux transporter outer membrane subunit [Pseudomonas taiwanensis]